MADDGSVQGSVWPLPAFYFKVEISDINPMSFREVSGLDVEVDPIEYRAGDSPNFSKISMPGMKKNSKITLKKGIFKSDNNFWNWINEIKLNTIKRRAVTISLLDESGAPTMVWKVSNAWPSKLSSDGFKSDSNDVAIETLELAHEGITIENK
ncbi:MAG: phage tail protein [Culturomica sp.]|jgi:phage tail-like protein|nr:phage tail protein [Culturomica sp.]